MNKKEIGELKKQFTITDNTLTCICGCYVDGEGTMKTTFHEAFPPLPEEEQFKYLDLFKKGLSGMVGKTLFDLDFSISQEQEEDGFHSLLLALRASKFKDETLLSSFYEQMMEQLDMDGNYLILLGRGVYDIPGKSADNETMFDASDDVYEYLLCILCPVKLSKPGLSYQETEGRFGPCPLNWAVDMPSTGFLFPAFTNRSTDIHSALLFVKNAKSYQSGLVEGLFGHMPLIFGDTQKEAFAALLSDGLGEKCGFETVVSISGELMERLEETGDEPGTLSCSELQGMLLEHGADMPDIESLSEQYEAYMQSPEPMLLSHLVGNKKTEIRTEEAVLQLSAERAETLITTTQQGRTYLMLPLDGEVTVNGVPVCFKGGDNS